MSISKVALLQSVDFVSFINSTEILIITDELFTVWIQKALPNLKIAYYEQSKVINYLNNPMDCQDVDCEIYSKSNVRILLTEIQAKKLNSIDENKVFILKEVNSLKVCLEFKDVFEEACYITEHMTHYSNYYVASNNQVLNNTLLAMNPRLHSFEKQNYINNYHAYVFEKLTKMLLGLNRDYENTELLKLHKLDDSYIQILDVNAEESFSAIWNKHFSLIKKLNVLETKYTDGINSLIEKYCKENNKITISDSKDYYNLLMKVIINYSVKDEQKKMKCIIPFESIPWLKADHLHIAAFANKFGENDRLLCSMNSHYGGHTVSYHCADQLNLSNIASMKVIVQHKKTKKTPDLEVNYQFPDINSEAMPKILRSYDIARGDNNVMSFYSKCILSLKSVNYSTEEYTFKHICKIVLQYLNSFNVGVVEEYFKHTNLPLLDQLKIKSKMPDIMRRINDYFQDKKLKVSSSFIKANLHLAHHSLDLVSYYDMLFINDDSAVIVKLINDYEVSKSKIAYLKHYYSNVLILTFSKALKKYNIKNIEFCFIGMNDLFSVDLSQISLYDLEYKIHCQTYSIINPSQESMNYSLENSVLTLQNANASCFLNIMRSYDNVG